MSWSARSPSNRAEASGCCGPSRCVRRRADKASLGGSSPRVKHAPTGARLRGLYLLTTTAEPFFRAVGYDELEHWELPESIRDTEEYRSLCPETATAMMKRLR